MKIGLVLICLLLTTSVLAHKRKYMQAHKKKERYKERLVYLGFDPEDPRERDGMNLMFSGDEIEYGLPKRILKDSLRFKSDKGRYVRGFLPSPQGVRSNESLPLGMNQAERDGVTIVNQNCFNCHAGVMDGVVTAGAPSRRINVNWFRRSYKNLNKYLFLLGWSFSEEEKNRIRGYQQFYEDVVEPTTRTVRVRGENVAHLVSWMMVARMKDPQKNFDQIGPGEESKYGDLFTEDKLALLDPQPFWNLKYKDYSYWTGFAYTESPTTYSTNQMDHHPKSTGDVLMRLNRTKRYLNYARSLKAPAYTRRHLVNLDMAQRGRTTFHNEGRCFNCHGTYNETGDLLSFPNLRQVNVGTDSLYAETLQEYGPLFDRINDNFSRFRDNLNNDIFAPKSNQNAVEAPAFIGYTPPPLKGIWATAPYFHNGSVPTLEQVLNSKKRVSIWRQSDDPFAYDHVQMGLKYKKKSKPRKSYYNTNTRGRSNDGHQFGDHLSARQRKELIEFLKLL